LPEYLWLILRSDYFVRAVKGLSTGVTGRHRVKLDKLMQVEIPVPPLQIQLGIAKHIQRMKEHISAAKEEADQAYREVSSIIGLPLFEATE
jgi:restriction endonuclease S subunit